MNSFTKSSMSADLAAPVQQLGTLAHTLFASLGPAATRPPPPPPVAAFIAADDALRAAVAHARTHQARQRRIAALEEEVLALDARWRAAVAALEEGRRELAALIDEGDTHVSAMQRAKESAVPHTELLAYAHAVSAFTSAPPGMPDLTAPPLPGAPPPPLFFPPFPNEEKMRRGRLNAEVPLGRAGETHDVGAPPVPEVPVHEAAPAMQSYRQDLEPQQSQIFDLDLDLNPDL